jgi:hypothetical protein
MSIPLFAITEDTDKKNSIVIRDYENEMRKRDQNARSGVKIFGGYAYVDKRPENTEILDGKKQRVFYNRCPVYGKRAAEKSAMAQLHVTRPIESREFDDNPPV